MENAVNGQFVYNCCNLTQVQVDINIVFDEREVIKNIEGK